MLTDSTKNREREWRDVEAKYVQARTSYDRFQDENPCPDKAHDSPDVLHHEEVSGALASSMLEAATAFCKASAPDGTAIRRKIDVVLHEELQFADDAVIADTFRTIDADLARLQEGGVA